MRNNVKIVITTAYVCLFTWAGSWCCLFARASGCFTALLGAGSSFSGECCATTVVTFTPIVQFIIENFQCIPDAFVAILTPLEGKLFNGITPDTVARVDSHFHLVIIPYRPSEAILAALSGTCVVIGDNHYRTTICISMVSSLMVSSSMTVRMAIAVVMAA